MSPTSASGTKRPYMLAAEQLRDNEGQWQAYNSTGPCVILAGPGSGKTKTLTIKLARMLEEDVRRPRRIACITYSKQCARELKRRLSLLGVEDGHRASIGTLHSFCLQHIVLPYAHLTPLPKKYPITVASTEEMENLKQEALDKTIANEQWGPRFDKYRRSHLDRTAANWHGDDLDAAAAIEKYEALLDDRGLIDYDGMVLIGLHLVEQYEWIGRALAARFPVLVVDEYQDLGQALDRLVQCLCFKAGMRLVAVGDADQSIYGFTGAEPSLLRNLAERDGVETVTLRLNYRCGSAIIQASEAALGEERGFQSRRDEPGVVYFHPRPKGIEDQAEFVCQDLIPAAIDRLAGRKLGDVAVLYLDKNDGNVIAQAVANTGWQFIRVDANNPYQASPVTYWLEDCAAWCAGAWKTGDIRLSELVNRWLRFNERLSTDKERRSARVSLVKFLYAHRESGILLCDWLTRLLAVCLQPTLELEPRLRDDKEKVEKLLKATAPDGPLQSNTVAFFGGLGGSPDHLTRIFHEWYIMAGRGRE
ncbi:MAG: ATP-dependent helicase [Chloroflexi bacterium]|nr:ATP-dependent helicase [Chloroflexota bacterium]